MQKTLLFVLVRTIEHNSANVRSPPLISCKPRLKTFFGTLVFHQGRDFLCQRFPAIALSLGHIEHLT